MKKIHVINRILVISAAILLILSLVFNFEMSFIILITPVLIIGAIRTLIIILGSLIDLVRYLYKKFK